MHLVVPPIAQHHENPRGDGDIAPPPTIGKVILGSLRRGNVDSRGSATHHPSLASKSGHVQEHAVSIAECPIIAVASPARSPSSAPQASQPGSNFWRAELVRAYSSRWLTKCGAWVHAYPPQVHCRLAGT